ncbi:DUF4082 domain-containing protein [Nocardioides mesophilus]|uniref:DUF4082 domain-containing protein n=1 Tax=Nocardioides mesophilus TaxID=433659 RepID=A0A7G9R9A6_9ACTN|nr:DUF4082 domain-containing protein [Nocardioides mesophilus]QNN52181.1 DUF4082 domain-containing protein [Nocardioides mesophilus]
MARITKHVRFRAGGWHVAALVLAMLAALLTVPLATSSPAAAAPCDAPVTSPVACENTKPGNPESEWGITGSGSSTIQGFATDISIDQGGTVQFKVDTSASSFRLDIYRMGYYGGDGARKVATVTPTSVRNQPACLTSSTTGLIDCGNWTVSASWSVPADAVSGIYFARLVRTDGTAGASHVYFVVRDDDGASQMLFQTSDTTWQAYNAYGGNSLYQGQPAGRAYKVSYNRPFTTRDNAPEDMVFNSEYPMVRFMERNGYDVSYSTGVDTDRRGAELLEHKVFLSVGHDEYWSGNQRSNVEKARAAGVNLAFFSGNEVFWKTRWENSIDASGTPYRTLVSYKETLDNAVTDPASPTWTGTWRDPRFSPPEDGGRPENALTGNIFMVNCCQTDMSVRAADGQMRFWRNTRVANLTGTQTTTIGSNVIGYEWDEDLDNGSRPPGAFRLSETDASGQVLQDYGSTYSNGSATHSMTMYRAASGALVFGAGTIQWSWALDENHDRGSAAADPAAQQATVNLFADMSVQPTTLQTGLVATTKSSDVSTPTSTITSPAANGTLAANTAVTVTGTATDAGGGRVGGVEVSTDGGTTWHRAEGRESWSYTFTTPGSGNLTVRSRATDDSGNIETPAAGVTVSVGGAVTCPCTIWPSTATPAATDTDTGQVELGVKFRAAQDGVITGIRFYKATANTGTHVGSLWSRTGTRLAQVTFSNESASGWQQATFSTPVAVTANTTYVASYNAPNGRYSTTAQYFATSATTRGPLTALQNGTDGGNGVYNYGPAGSFPSSTYGSTNYWVDVVYDTGGPDTSKPTVVDRTPASGATDVPVASPVTATFSEQVTGSSVTMTLKNAAGTAVTGTTTYSTANTTATFTPGANLTAGTTYTATVSGASDAAGNVMDPVTWTFTTTAATAGTCPCTIWPSTATPAATDTDTGQVELGVKFRAAQDGVITGIRFYKATANTGTHVGSLWSRTGTRLAQVTFSNESASGWQQATFSTPVAVTANTTYVASYNAPNGRYSTTAQYFATSATTRGPLTALQNGTDGGNGVYNYGPAGSFPSSTYGSTNYWVDVVYDTGGPDTSKPTVVDRTPASGATDVPVASPVTATFSEQVTGSSVTMTLKNAAGTAVTGTTTYSTANTTATFTPGANLTAGTTYTATVSGASDAAGNVMDPVTWTFTTTAATAGTCPCTIWPSTATPAVTQTEKRAVELGVKFRAAQDGVITGIRFYKATANTGTHVGSLWNTAGTRLGQVTFSNESASGWQQATFSTPVAVTANTTYIASYNAPNGGYSTTGQYFATSATTRGPLTALQNGTDGGNGVYRYGPAGTFPTSTYNSTNYWVDVVYDTGGPDTSKPTVVARTPAPGATGVPSGTSPTAQLSEPVVESSITMTLTASGSTTPVSATTTYSSTTSTVTLTPLAPLATNTSYDVALSGARDAAGNVMDPVSWSFTTAATADGCPCTIWPSTATPAGTDSDTNSVELGVKFRSAVDGYATGVRFYKGGTTNAGPHTGSVWNTAGTRLGQVSFSNESASGWQQATFASPIRIVANTTYVVSYHAPVGRYSTTAQYFATSATTRGPLTALQNGTDGGNGVYGYGPDGTYPGSTYNSENYWVDVVFSTTATDTTKPSVIARSPAAGATGVSSSTTVTAQFDEPVTGSSVAMTLKTGAGTTVSGTTTYSSSTNTATFTPAAALAASTDYTAAVSSATDAAGNVMDPVSWTFTTAAPPPPPVDQGPGGRIGLVTSSAAPSTKYLAEILRAEGLNEFTSIDATGLNSTNLANFDVVVLGTGALTSTQLSALSTWVSGGGNLVAMRPDAQLDSLLGVTTQSGTTSNGYLAVDAATGPGAGIATDTLQFHGSAKNYTLAGAQQVARLYSSATAATAFPAVTLNDVGTSGGQAAAFAFDLASSVIQTRQGNPAWAGQERDGSAPIRSDDQFFGARRPTGSTSARWRCRRPTSSSGCWPT